MSEITLAERRERVFLVLAGVFLCAMTMLNIIGITKFVQLGPMSLAVGVLPYPLTFLCTDLISELYGRARANFLVTVGLGLNIFIIAIMWLGHALPGVAENAQPPWQTLQLAADVALPSGDVKFGSVEMFELLYACTSGAVLASMLAYVAAQYIDVHIFHWIKQRTGERHLWARNNGSTVVSQAVDSLVVISVTFGAAFLAGTVTLATMLGLMLSNYLFKLSSALLDTGPMYFLSARLKRYLELN